MSSFRKELQRRPVDIPRSALVFAREIAYPELDVAYYLQEMDRLAYSAQQDVPESGDPGARALRLSTFLFRQLGFKGNREGYSDPDNSYLNRVLESGLGIPISLSVVFIGVARRLGIPAQGVGLPGHFIVRIPQQREDIYLDPFHEGKRLFMEDMLELVRATTGYEGKFQPDWLAPVSARNTLSRMLNNLRLVYVQRHDWEKSLAVIERLRMLHPEHAEYLRDLGLIYYQTDSLRLAARYLERYLLAAPEAPDADQVKEYLQAATQRLAALN